MAILVCENLNYLYNVGTPFETAAIENIYFSADKSEIIGIIGHTGSGKSTLTQLLNGLEKPSSGTIYYNDEDLSLIHI